jgi:2-iminobutanoate/2-iminopropanoate deaminase
MIDRLSRSVIEPVNPKLNVSRNANLPHSPGIRVGDYIFLSGMGPIDGETGERNLGAIGDQVRTTLSNMRHMLESAGSSLAKVVKVNVLIYSMLEYENMNSVYREFFATDPPARTVCGVKLIGGHKVEIECVALA